MVITPEMKERLFGRSEAVGREIILAGRQFTVLAVRRDRLGDDMGQGAALVPIDFYQTLKRRAGPKSASELGYLSEPQVYGQPLDTRRYSEAAAQLRDALLPMLPADYRKIVKLSEDIPETTRKLLFQHKAAAARGAAGALACLLVSLIGLTNMLLVSVHQTIREMGLRRALGARRGHVLLHFLREGVLLSASGAALGLGLGVAVCTAARVWAGLPIQVSAVWAGAGSISTVAAGAVVSLVPALLAMRTDAAEALRYD